MRKAISILSMVITMISCNTKEEPIVTGPNIIGKTYYGFSNYKSPLPGSTTKYYIGYKFISETSVVCLNANYTPALVESGTVIFPEKFVVTSKTTHKYKLEYPKITVDTDGWGQFDSETLLTISGINMSVADPSTKTGKFITDSIK
jgi:hypothetical protein